MNTRVKSVTVSSNSLLAFYNLLHENGGETKNGGKAHKRNLIDFLKLHKQPAGRRKHGKRSLRHI